MQLVQIRAPGVAPEGVLLDRLERQVRYLRISLTDRCNYRCTYCMPDRGVPLSPKRDVLSLEEVVELATAFAGWGVRRVRLTGGEPTIRKNLPWLIERLAAVPLEVVMTTNGEALAGVADSYAAAGLKGVTVSLDSLDPDRFSAITRRGRLDRVLAGIERAIGAGLPLKLNTVAVAGFNDDELGDIARFAWSRGAVPRFIELMPMSGGELYAPGKLLSAQDVREAIESQLGVTLAPQADADAAGLGPASYFAVREGEFAGCQLGTIGAMTENFCASCNRLRLSATGTIHGCLADDADADLKPALRGAPSGSPEQRRALEDALRRVLANKRDGHQFQLDGRGGPQKAMVSIGG